MIRPPPGRYRCGGESRRRKSGCALVFDFVFCYSGDMDALLRYRGRTVTKTDVEFIRDLVAARPGQSRRRLSQDLCAAWGWTPPNGAPRDMVCRGLMLALERAGLINLPPVRFAPPNPLSHRAPPEPVEVDSSPVISSLAELGQLTFRQVRRTADEPIFNGLMETHHYLGYVQPVGEHLKFMVSAGERPMACFAFSSAPRHLGPRDSYLGWSPGVRQRNIRHVAYNSRYLIMPWVRVPPSPRTCSAV